ncbi:MAG: hemin uptake protein HemP [Pseudohongiella sp.]|nr:hemin uptake protein HemP [Pseudohongiella sp.]
MTTQLINLAPELAKPRVIDSATLFDRQHTTVTILHQGEHYTLRLTASNKLILTK